MNNTYQLAEFLLTQEAFRICIIDLIKIENYSCGRLSDMKYFVKDVMMIIFLLLSYK